MHCAITWDGARLVVIQRPSWTAWFGVLATTLLAVVWYPMTHDAFPGWATFAGIVLLAAVAVALATSAVRGYRRIEASDQVVRSGQWSVPATQVRILTVRHERHWTSNQYGRGYVTEVILFVGLVGGRTIDLLRIYAIDLDGRASGQHLADGLAALPYGRPPRNRPTTANAT